MKKNILLKVAARALLVGMQKIPVVGGIIEIGRECWQVLREAQEEAREEERVVQLEQAAAITPQEARSIAQEVVTEMRNAGQTIDVARAEAVQDIISVMPAQIHERTRATLDHARRLGTQASAALPVTNRFSDPEREAFYTSLIPLRRPQFHIGDTIPHYSLEWRLERLIGAGGFGEVWLARHQKMRSKMPMAIKFCQDETSAKLLKKEGAMLDTLIEQLPIGTPHIVALLELNLMEMPYWLAYEYVDGGTLESRIRSGAMDWATAWNLFEPMLQGMAMVHELNIVHRDLKPANILLDKNQKPRIADFGIGKLIATQVATTRQSQRSRSMTTRGYGSLGYMSPEQASGNDLAHATDDLYALGVILWQMLRGTVQQFPEFPDDIADLAVADTVKQALSRCRFSRRDKRPQTARELLTLLEPVKPTLVNESVEPKPSMSFGNVVKPFQPLPPLPSLLPLQSLAVEQEQTELALQLQELQAKSQAEEKLLARLQQQREAEEQRIEQRKKQQQQVEKELARLAELQRQREAEEQRLAAVKQGAVQHGHYIIHPNGTVTDTRTKLTWKRCSEGQTWNGKTCVGEAKEMTWNEIMPNEKQKSWPKFAGHNDWRVPTVEELKTLVYCSSGKPKDWNNTGKSCEGDYQQPTIDKIAFPNTSPDLFWTSSPVAADSRGAWLVHFDYGHVGNHFRGDGYAVRLVRSGQ